MQRSTKIYINFFGYTIADWIPCENCNKTGTEIHHLQFKSKGGTDEIDNLMALCRDCHNIVHNVDPKLNEKLKEIHRNKVTGWRNCTGK